MLLLHHGLYVMWCRQDIGLEVPQIQVMFLINSYIICGILCRRECLGPQKALL